MGVQTVLILLTLITGGLGLALGIRVLLMVSVMCLLGTTVLLFGQFTAQPEILKALELQRVDAVLTLNRRQAQRGTINRVEAWCSQQQPFRYARVEEGRLRSTILIEGLSVDATHVELDEEVKLLSHYECPDTLNSFRRFERVRR